jgi:membrane-associated protease RseP (regulator of RpoE activity)
LRTQLSLSDEGLVVDEVIEKSPAEKANLKKFDVLVKAGEKPLKSPEDLVTIVQSSKEAPIALTLIRSGKRETIQVTPTKDAASQPGVFSLEIPAHEGLRKWLSDQSGSYQLNPDGSVTIRRPHPGIALRFGHPTAPLPKNVTITISKTGDQPAKITVKRDNKSWEIAEDKIDELPEDLRPIVRSYVGQAPSPPSARVRSAPRVEWRQSDNLAKALEELKKAQGEAAKARPNRRSVEERLESLDKKLETLQKALEQLRDTKP